VHGFLPLHHNPLDSSLCANLVEAEKRFPHPSIVKKEPVDLVLIQAIVSKYARENSNLKDLRLATLCVFAYAGLLRSQEVLDIKASHITLAVDHLALFIPTSKNDVYRQGQHVFIAKSDRATCPYNLIIRYLNLARIKLDKSPDDYIFRNVVFLKSSNSYSLGTRRLSYSRFREVFKECISSLGYDHKIYGLHSFRSGGATTLAQFLGNNPSKERLLKLQGRWKSDHAKNMYIKEPIQDRLSASRGLGL